MGRGTLWTSCVETLYFERPIPSRTQTLDCRYFTLPLDEARDIPGMVERKYSFLPDIACQNLMVPATVVVGSCHAHALRSF